MLGSRSDASYFGPSFMIDDLAYEYEGYDVESILINCHYPVSPDKFVLMYGMIVKKSPVLGDKALETAQKFGEFIAKGFEQDIAIWKNKTRIENPCCARRTVRSTSCAAGTSSSTWTARTSPRT